MIKVAWVSFHSEAPNRGYWDQGLLERIFSKEIWDPVDAFEFTHVDSLEAITAKEGAVIVLPARYHTSEADIARLNYQLLQMPWAVLVLSSDEESLFPWRELTPHEHMKVWIMTPRSDLHEDFEDRFIGEYYQQSCPETLALYEVEAEQRPLGWYFSGQVTHERRVECMEAAHKLSGPSCLNETAGFTQGFQYSEYLRNMASAKIALAPSGPATPDSFRLYEALEAGCLPIVDASSPNGPQGYWDMVLPDAPFPVVGSWSQLPEVYERELEHWKARANETFAWWQGYKRDLAYALKDDIEEISGLKPEKHGLRDLITVVMPTSPIPSHPGIAVIEQTLESIWHYEELRDCEIIIAADGVRDAQSARTPDYEEYLQKLLWKANHKWKHVLPLLMPSHVHQANSTRYALERVRTPLVLFMEHDTPLTGAFPWKDLAAVVQDEDVNLIRFHHEAQVLEVHEHMMLDPAGDIRKLGNVPMRRTCQWSQRPHLAKTSFYNEIIQKYFGKESRTMIEDVMHGVLDTMYREYGEAGWRQMKVWMFTPPGVIKRSEHLDGREDDPKFDMYYEYEGHVTPEGAPARTPGRVD